MSKDSTIKNAFLPEIGYRCHVLLCKVEAIGRCPSNQNVGLGKFLAPFLAIKLECVFVRDDLYSRKLWQWGARRGCVGALIAASSDTYRYEIVHKCFLKRNL
jgi:hypothetical protein